LGHDAIGGRRDRRPRPPAPADRIDVWRLPDVPGLDLRRGTFVRAPVARHWHDEYQLCLIEGGGGELRHARAVHATPPGSLFVVPPGDVHSNHCDAPEGCSFRTMYVEADRLAWAAAEVGVAGPPDFARPMVDDGRFATLFRRVHRSFERGTSRLESETELLALLVALVSRHASGRRPVRPPGREPGAVERAREYLHARFREPVSLADLARVAGLSPFHLSRVFRDRTGLPPHAYQNQLRVHHARRLIEAGQTTSLAARLAGFADQSHLTRHFRRVLAVPPGVFRERKNVQDAGVGPG
jgi:AraC-like DNA-binding protein